MSASITDYGTAPSGLAVRNAADSRLLTVVYYLIQQGVIQMRRVNAGSPCWITLDASTEQELRHWVRTSSKLRRVAGAIRGSCMLPVCHNGDDAVPHVAA